MDAQDGTEAFIQFAPAAVSHKIRQDAYKSRRQKRSLTISYLLGRVRSVFLRHVA